MIVNCIYIYIIVTNFRNMEPIYYTMYYSYFDKLNNVAIGCTCLFLTTYFRMLHYIMTYRCDPFTVYDLIRWNRSVICYFVYIRYIVIRINITYSKSIRKYHSSSININICKPVSRRDSNDVWYIDVEDKIIILLYIFRLKFNSEHFVYTPCSFQLKLQTFFIRQ